MNIEAMDYMTGCLIAFGQWQYIPDPELETREDVKRLRASFLDAARSLIYLCQPPRSKLVTSLTIAKFIEEFPDLAHEISDILAMLKDAADWAVASCDPLAPNLPLLPEESAEIDRIWKQTSSLASPGLRIASDRVRARIREHCPLSRRSRFALIRLVWAFEWADRLVIKLKGTDTLAYIRRLNERS